MGAWKKCALSAGNTHVHKIPRFKGGGGYFGIFWGGADFIFMGARIFLKLSGPIRDTSPQRAMRFLRSYCTRGIASIFTWFHVVSRKCR